MAPFRVTNDRDAAGVIIVRHQPGYVLVDLWQVFWAFVDTKKNQRVYCFGILIDSNKPPTIDNVYRFATTFDNMKDILNDPDIIVQDAALKKPNEGESWLNSWCDCEIKHFYMKSDEHSKVLLKSKEEIAFKEEHILFVRVPLTGLPKSYQLSKKAAEKQQLTAKKKKGALLNFYFAFVKYMLV